MAQSPAIQNLASALPALWQNAGQENFQNTVDWGQQAFGSQDPLDARAAMIGGAPDRVAHDPNWDSYFDTLNSALGPKGKLAQGPAFGDFSSIGISNLASSDAAAPGAGGSPYSPSNQIGTQTPRRGRTLSPAMQGLTGASNAS